MISITVSNDHLRLGPGSTPNHLRAYCERLETSLSRELGVTVTCKPGSVDRARVEGSPDDLVERAREVMREIEDGHDWVEYL